MDHGNYFGQLDHLQDMGQQNYSAPNRTAPTYNGTPNYAAPTNVPNNPKMKESSIKDTTIVNQFVGAGQAIRELPVKLAVKSTSPLRSYPTKDWIIIGTMVMINFFTIFVVPTKLNGVITLVQTLIAVYMYYKESLKPDPASDVYHDKWYVFGGNMVFSLGMTLYFLYKSSAIEWLVSGNTILTVAYMSALLTMASLYSYVFLDIPEDLNQVDYDKRRDSIKEMRIVWLGQESGVINKIYLSVLIYLTVMITKNLYGDEISQFLSALAYGDKVATVAAPVLKAVIN